MVQKWRSKRAQKALEKCIEKNLKKRSKKCSKSDSKSVPKSAQKVTQKMSQKGDRFFEISIFWSAATGPSGCTPKNAPRMKSDQPEKRKKRKLLQTAL